MSPYSVVNYGSREHWTVDSQIMQSRWIVIGLH